MQRKRIGIVGLGVAGSCVGVLLARMGHEVTMFEQTAEPGPVGAGVLLQPSGQAVLERMGILERVVEKAERISRLFAVTHHKKVLVDLAYGEIGAGTCAYGIHRGELFGTLYEELKGTAAKIYLGKRVVRFEDAGNCVKLFLDNGECCGEFDFLLAADGARSALRASSGLKMKVMEYPHGAVWAMGKCSAIRGRLWQVTRGSRQLCGLLPMGAGRCSLFWSLEKKDHGDFVQRGFAGWKQEVLAMCPEAEEIFDSVREMEQARFVTYMHVRMKRSHEPRCLFMGDAGHAMSPHLGQGINLALIDAYCFAHAVGESEDFAEACERYGELRRSHLRVYSAVTYALSPFFQSRGVIKGILRDMFLPLMPKFGPLRRRMVMTMSGLRGGFLRRRFELPGEEKR